MFKLNDQRGFQITFENGVTLSTQFGRGSYCENRSTAPGVYDDPGFSHDAEIAVWDKNGKWITKKILKKCGIPAHCDDVLGRVEPDFWAVIVNASQNWKDKSLNSKQKE